MLKLQEAKEKISEELFCTYYSNHTKRECMSHFNINEYVFKQLFSLYKCAGSKNETINLDNINKKEFLTYYNEHTIEETKTYFNIKNNHKLYQCLEHFNIDCKRNTTQEEHMNQISYEQLYEYYIIRGYSIHQLVEIFKCKYSLISYLLKKYNIQKDEQQIKENRISHNIEKYGHEYALSDESLLKRNATILKRYDSFEQYYKIRKKKSENTSFVRYGKNYYSQTKEFKDKYTKTCNDKYGYNSVLQAKISTQSKDYQEAWFDKEKCIKIIEEFQTKPTYDELATRFDVSKYCVMNLIEKYQLNSMIKKISGYSHYEEELVTFIGRDLCECHNKSLLNRLEIDIYIPSKKIAIEFNGDYWHSSLYKDKNYHFDKSKRLSELGIRLIHIWEYEWTNEQTREKIKSMLNIALGRIDQKIYARNCIIKEITNKEAREFNNKNHLQGHRNAQITYGLFYNNELVQLMSFSKTKYNRNLKEDNSWEIIRGCPGSNNIVVGGVSKLFSHFVKLNKPNKVFSYCDFNKFNGVSYEKLGMKFIGYTSPDVKYCIDRVVVNRNPRKYKFNKDNCEYKLYGAGSMKFLWERKD